jgi:hypothetical protein
MDEGLSLQVALSGATLVTVLGLVVKIYLASKTQKIGPQPFEVRQVVEQVTERMCNERHHGIESNQSNVFSRLVAVEKECAALRATVSSIQEQYRSIDEKLTTLLRR